MTTDLAIIVDQVDRITASWPDLLNTPIPNQTKAAAIQAQVQALTIPASPKAIAAAIAPALSLYYVSSLPETFQREVAKLYGNELKKFPEWAIRRAVKWWISAENERRGNKPLPGDIAARARVEMGPVKVAEHALRRFAGGTRVVKPVSTEPSAATAEQAADVLKRAGVKVDASGKVVGL